MKRYANFSQIKNKVIKLFKGPRVVEILDKSISYQSLRAKRNSDIGLIISFWKIAAINQAHCYYGENPDPKCLNNVIKLILDTINEINTIIKDEIEIEIPVQRLYIDYTTSFLHNGYSSLTTIKKLKSYKDNCFKEEESNIYPKLDSLKKTIELLIRKRMQAVDRDSIEYKNLKSRINNLRTYS